MMDYAARVGDPVQHSYVQTGGEVGELAGFAVGAAVVAVTAEATVATTTVAVTALCGALTIATGGLFAAVLVGVLVTAAAVGTVTKMMSAGQKIGEAVGKTQTNPHAGDIADGAKTVFIGAGMPKAARITDPVSCHVGKKILSGSKTVIIEAQCASRKGEKTECSGYIRDGEHSVLIGGESVSFAAAGPETSDAYRRFNDARDTANTIAGWISIDPETQALNVAGLAASTAAKSSNATVAAVGSAAKQSLGVYSAAKAASSTSGNAFTQSSGAAGSLVNSTPGL